jgi:hypothetical protein
LLLESSQQPATAGQRLLVEAVVALCDCPVDITGRVFCGLDLIDEWGLTVRRSAERT